MKFIVALAALTAVPAVFAAAPAVTANSYKITYDTFYDTGSNSVNNFACSGTLDKEGYTTASSLPGFPFIGGAGVITGYDAPDCGTCWQLNYNDNSIYLLAVDYAGEGIFNIGKTAFNTLTNNNTNGVVEATAWQVATSKCSGSK
ncbi:uncharacterized protein FIBRA_06305 [Fibroporia radiculosa]|uniref:Cerato-platanin n=1 Tax=Fibroporia radiculosa TaxID=599839 RepID=J4GB35_9APHY|nr:uncharacterized protein FIBRA_06305 [Fibroporia radiculosa]CCM04143.1 predicted protein [Fibroporia radiculosa]